MSSNPSIVALAQQTPSKGPPPLPAAATTAPAAIASEGNAVEEIFFEGIDGHAESLPSSDPDVCALDDTDMVSYAELCAPTCAPTALPSDDELAQEEEPEDPARVERRRIARLGVAWGAVGMIVLTGVALAIRPASDERSYASSARAAHVEAVAHAPAAPPSAPSVTTASVQSATTAASAASVKTPATAAHPPVAETAAKTTRAVVRKQGPGTAKARPATHAPSATHGKHAAPRHAATRKQGGHA